MYSLNTIYSSFNSIFAG